MQRKSERELVVTRVFNGPPRVFEVWTRRELLKRWWAPKSVLHERNSSKEALDEAVAGMEVGMPESFAQLDELLAALDASDEVVRG